MVNWEICPQWKICRRDIKVLFCLRKLCSLFWSCHKDCCNAVITLSIPDAGFPHCPTMWTVNFFYRLSCCGIFCPIWKQKEVCNDRFTLFHESFSKNNRVVWNLKHVSHNYAIRPRPVCQCESVVSSTGARGARGAVVMGVDPKIDRATRPFLGLSDMLHGDTALFLKSTGRHDVFLKSTGRHDVFLKSTGRHDHFL